MARFFNFYDPLEKRYVFNSFLVVVGLVEILILVFTLIWQLDEGIFTEHPRVIPFPWSPYLLATFVAPIALLFDSGERIQGCLAILHYLLGLPISFSATSTERQCNEDSDRWADASA